MSRRRNVSLMSVLTGILLVVLLAACSSKSGDKVKPVVSISSSATSTTASYKLEGYAFDAQGVTGLSYTLNGGSATDLTLDAHGYYSANLTLNAGDNTVTVTAKDAQGNTGTASATVTYNAPPGTLSVTPTAAKRGDTITISGSHFGATQGSGTVTVGGVAATISSWADDEVKAVIADGTPNGPQDVKLTSAYGSQTFHGLFVGVQYTGDAAGLQDFLNGLPKGTAVSLQAQTYDLSAATTPLILDNHGLYGQGESQTTLISGAAPASGIILLADYGQDSTVANMSIKTDQFAIMTGSMSTMSTLSVQGASPAIKFGTRTLTLPTSSKLTRQWGSHENNLSPLSQTPKTVTVPTITVEGALPVQPQGVTPPQVHLSNLNVSQVAGNGIFGINPSGGALPSSDISIDNVTYNGPTSDFAIAASGAVSVSDSTITADIVEVASATSTVSIANSDLEANEPSAGPSGGTVAVAAQTGLTIDQSTVRTTNGDAEIVGAILAMSGSIPTGGPISITGSTIEALDSNLADANDYGTLEIVTQFAPITLSDNTSIRSDRDMTIATPASAAGEADVTLSNNQGIKAGVFKADNPSNPVPAALMIGTVSSSSSLAPDTLDLENNTISSTQAIQVIAGASGPGNLVANGNTITAGDGNNDGMIAMGSAVQGSVTADGNHLTADGGIQVVAANLNKATATVTNNTLSAVGDNGPTAAVESMGGPCEVTGNTLEAQDTGADSSTDTGFICAGSAPTDTLTATGNSFSVEGDGTSYVVWGFEQGTVSASQNTVTSEDGLELDVSGTTGSISNNTALNLGDYGVELEGDAQTNVTLDSNAVTLSAASSGDGLYLDDPGQVTATNNTFTITGTPNATSTALGVETEPGGNPITVTATGNTFTNFTNALYFGDQPTTALGITATVNNNTFDFTIDAAPKVAELKNVKDAIDATNNQWGSNTNLATVQGYVTLSGDTTAQGGSINLDPITQPSP